METNLNNNQEQIALKEIATKKVIKLKSFYKHLFVYLIAMILFLLKEYTNLPLNVFPIKYFNWVVVIIWTAVIIGSVIDLVASFMIFDEEWEERKMRDILEKKYKKQKWE
ncbi:2TM domain-containing protein [Flavobacterium cutihirudinis]|uniref:2TM domain-containing protein n=1 Tax=Flavobacterium cutihirudinis TaxID=1265740 RepID=A0A3D9FUY9_9FLAO|nr:2TM domain-containing protein [Flavobacterium cutihirudinis]RED23764.1 2TM domain-containing protein [Flavobacterium cutihirudinis]